MATTHVSTTAFEQGAMSHFAETILRNKNYTHDKGGGRYESWPEAAERVVRSVMEPYLPDMVQRTLKLVLERKFVPGGRYLYAAGRKFPQIANCFLFSCREDTRQEWGRIADKTMNALMTGGGVGVVYSKLRAEESIIQGLGGKSTGPCALMRIINEQGRYIRQGGSRRCLPEGTLVHTHAGLVPIEKISVGSYTLTGDGYRKVLNNFNQGVQQTIRVRTQLGELECTPNHRIAVLAGTDGDYYWKQAVDLVEGDRLLFVPETIPGHPTTMPDFSFVRSKYSSTCKDIQIPDLDAEIAWMLGFLHGNGYVHVDPDGGKGHVTFAVNTNNPEARNRLVNAIERFGVNVVVRDHGENCVQVCTSSRQLALYFAAEFKKPKEPIAIHPCILQGTPDVRAAYLAGILDSDGSIKTRPLQLVSSIYPEFVRQLQSICASLGIPARMKRGRMETEKWHAMYYLVVVGKSQLRKLSNGLGKYSTKAAGLAATANKTGAQCCYTFPARMMKEEGKWAGVRKWHKNRDADITLENWERKHGTSRFVPVTVKEVLPGRSVQTYDLEVQGRNEFVAAGGLLVHNSAIWAGLHWNHADIFKFIEMKDWSDAIRRCREEDYNFPAPMDGTNVSVILDDDFFAAYHDPAHRMHDHAHNVFWTAVRHMLRTGEPGFSIDIGENAGEHGRNACCEIVTRDDGDICNLGSANMGRLRSLDEFREVVECGTAFLLCGTLYGKLPFQEMYAVREKNRRIGLGLMGVHEWLLRRGMHYAPNDQLAVWLQVYGMSGAFADRYADRLSVSRPIATRAIAPTGTISIIAETTSGIEPIYAVALKRRYLEGQQWKAQYVIDPAAKRLIDAGIDPNLIEDAYVLAEDVERRVSFQAWLQQHVDHGISSTINLPPWGSSLNNESTVTQFGRRLMEYLPRLRGITAYPDGARGGQPLNRVSYAEAVKHVGKDFIEEAEEEYSNGASCKNGVCGE